MTPRPWFGRKRIGWGLRPASWQGWALTALYVFLVVALAAGLAAQHATLFVIALAALTAVYIAIAILTSRGRR